MSYACSILADSGSSAGHRLTTFQITFPRFVLAEFNTHRMLSRNSASSRAIPVEKRIAMIESDPFVPEAFAANKHGMQAGEALDEAEQEKCREIWLNAADNAAFHASCLAEMGVHKQWANRLLEPFAWHTVIVTATEWANFWALRISEHAQPEIRIIASMMRQCFDESVPSHVTQGEWHLPLVGREYGDGPNAVLSHPDRFVKICVARCARVSYLTHEGVRDPEADLALYDRLVSSGHMSPLEHAARPMTAAELSIGRWCGNFRGWVQHRKEIPGESVFINKEEA
jgi:thymidylate synthase ThyX